MSDVYTTQWWYHPRQSPPPSGVPLLILYDGFFCIQHMSADKKFWIDEMWINAIQITAYSILPESNDIESSFANAH